MALTPTVATGQLGLSAWGNEIRDRTTQVFATLAELKAQWASPPDGAHAYLTSEDSECVAKGGTWRWWRKTFPQAFGNTSYFTYGAGATAGTSWSQLHIAGTNLTLSMSAALATPATSGAPNIGQLASGYWSGIRYDYVMACSHGSGSGSGRIQVNTGGALLGAFAAGDNAVAATALLFVAQWAVNAPIAA